MDESQINEMLLKVVGLMSMQYCKTCLDAGMTTEAINAQLVDVIPALDKWRAETLATITGIKRQMDEPCRPYNATTH